MNILHDNVTKYMIIILCITLFLIICIWFYKLLRLDVEHMVNIEPIDRPVKWKMSDGCKYMMTKTFKTVLDKNNLKETKDDDYVIYFPCTYNKIDDEIKAVKPKKSDQRIFIVNNADELSSKSSIWKNLVSKYGRDGAKKIMPTTYVLYDSNDVDLLKKEYNKYNIYILKKNIQRQEGLKITKDLDKMVNGYKDGYVVAQELLQDPYTINGRKINMRFYLLLVCKNNEVSAYAHEEGFMYYTKVHFVKGSLSDDTNITTGYIDRKVYEENPLTLGDFRNYLDNNHRKLTPIEISYMEQNVLLSALVFNRIYDLLRKVVIAVSHTTCIDSHLKSNITFQLFGADIALNDKLEPQLMEVNKGPDLGTKDERDGNIKHGVVTDVFKILKVLPNNGHKFIKILE